MARLSSRYEALGIYSRRVIRRGKNSFPYISIDSFKSNVEYVVPPLNLLRNSNQFRRIKEAKTLFVPSLYLEEFLDHYEKCITAKVIVSGNSDTEFHKSLKLPSCVNLLLLQNSYISDQERVQTLPIGLENYSLGLNGNPKHISHTSLREAKNAILFGPFSSTHPDRQIVREAISNSPGPWYYCPTRLKPKEYNALVASYKFVACVRGNGVDTHRTWETLYRGRYPILINNLWARSLQSLNLPIYLVKNWDPDNLKELAAETAVDFRPSKLLPLWMPYWIDKMRSFT